jgi:hypothetical protein
MNKQLTYFVDRTNEDLLVSRCGSEVLLSQICYTDFRTCEGKVIHAYEVSLFPGKENILNNLNSIEYGRWTGKVPFEWKNIHREGWGLPPLKEEKTSPEWYLDWNSIFIPTPENVEIPPDLAEFFNGRSDSRRVHWYGNIKMFKTWCVTAPLSVVLEEIKPFLDGTEFTLKLKCW